MSQLLTCGCGMIKAVPSTQVTRVSVPQNARYLSSNTQKLNK